MQSTMRPDLIILLPPLLYQYLGLKQCVKYLDLPPKKESSYNVSLEGQKGE